MDTAPQAPAAVTSKATPLDFFLWLGALVCLYSSVIAIITLLFEYINHVFPDPLAYHADAYSGSIRVAMATLIVLAPIGIFLLRTIRLGVMREPAKAQIWVRRWALILTIFVAVAMGAIDLITLITTFLGGEITMRFILKVFVVLVVSLFVGAHYIADFRGYWVTHPRRAALVGAKAGILAFIVVVAGFFIIGTPSEMRLMRFDEQKVSDLQGIQWQVLDYWQSKQKLPTSLAGLSDPLSGSIVPVDPESNEPYRYEATGKSSFRLCATFNQSSPDTAGKGAYPSMGYGEGMDMSYPSMPANENWSHEAGETCFERTIDPERYPPYPKPL
ncbi:MAG: hypothetical protein QOE22_202 [Candidatus Parcubacteria bacterium]|jgi:hypothetical protein|nr:hypothetical protein [Candidatus Parcubacteria bacterium]